MFNYYNVPENTRIKCILDKKQGEMWYETNGDEENKVSMERNELFQTLDLYPTILLRGLDKHIEVI